MTNDEQSIRLVGFHVSMLYIHHRMMITYLERKEPHLIDGYAQSDFLGAQHHARSLLDALNAMIAEGADLKRVLGETPIETTHFAVFAAQLALISSGPANTDSAERLLQKSLISGLGKLAAHTGQQGFTMFGDDSSGWLRGSLETMQAVTGR
jgi:hypothetical protein